MPPHTRLRTLVRRAGEPLAAVALGGLSGIAEGLFLVVAGLVWASPGRPVVAGHARAIAAWERRRLSLAPVHTPDERRVVAYLAARLWPAFLGAITVALFVIGLVLAAIVARAFAIGELSLLDLLGQALIGSALLAINVQAVGSVLRLDRWLAHRLLETGSRDALEQRITELTATRAGVMAAVDAERRRIERDLHDGLQQRLVALGMLLGRARRSRDPDRAATLLAQAHDDAQRALDELREVAWRVYPSALDDGTLDDALSMVAQRSTVPVRIGYRLGERPPPQVETVLYFVACEAITNAAKHSGATVIDIEIGASATEFKMTIRDDGHGGADPTGSGLQGLTRRVAALDGRLTVHSPLGAGTTIHATLPNDPPPLSTPHPTTPAPPAQPPAPTHPSSPPLSAAPSPSAPAQPAAPPSATPSQPAAPPSATPSQPATPPSATPSQPATPPSATPSQPATPRSATPSQRAAPAQPAEPPPSAAPPQQISPSHTVAPPQLVAPSHPAEPSPSAAPAQPLPLSPAVASSPPVALSPSAAPSQPMPPSPPVAPSSSAAPSPPAAPSQPAAPSLSAAPSQPMPPLPPAAPSQPAAPSSSASGPASAGRG
ncbi:hypothetical protein Aab01nite_32780 [Paractinoplanes abujensis]|uniref:histidine kinase n=1 Tax=Paractinoplanes abujensis TaxID=882441 RepID=A0A7W7D044_9ACTN|nr:sensor histidine kinase [Actinoplanes abujensis]MBB4697828.1 signal transduction histidine kinase [Actinoplanes abujensis]GID19688.1 hypothetical protein Aab01nite_32780 [Actinoplanes abujensis]